MTKTNFNELNPSAQDIQRFWQKVAITANPAKCWEWQAYLSKKGYGQFKLQNKAIAAHRVAYLIFYNQHPKDLGVLHKCDNRKCCNPHHFFLGTNADNTHDMIQKGRNRHPKGEEQWGSIFTNKQIIEIRNLKATTKLTYEQIAKRYGTFKQVIFLIVKRKSWKHI